MLKLFQKCKINKAIFEASIKYNIDEEAIFTGTKGSSGAFTSNGAITLGDGFISAENFFIDTDGNARTHQVERKQTLTKTLIKDQKS